MSTEVIVGRSNASPVKVPLDKTSVSGVHAKITVSDSNVWTIEDLDSKAGTYLRDEVGEFHQVFKKQIAETDIIRLGAYGANSFTFMAHRALHPDDPFTFEFRQLQHTLKAQQELEEKKGKAIERNGWISKASGLLVVMLCAVLGSICGFDIDPNVRYMLIAFAPVLVGLLFKNDAKALKQIRKRREKLLVCPNCGRPLSEFEVQQQQCMHCKAK